MNVLCIGNSFSIDATKYLNRIAKADGEDITVIDLFIGGCPLDRHFRNMYTDERAYVLDINGNYSDFFVSLKEALLNREWDVITFQQVSHNAPYYETYQPYLDELAAYVRKYAPKAKFAIHQTWAYEEGCDRLTKELGYEKQADMFADIEKSYNKAAKAIKADFIIPSGAVFQELIKAGIGPVHRDGFHASYGIGRYALGLLWYRVLTGKDITNNTFCDFMEEVPSETAEKIRECVMRTKI